MTKVNRETGRPRERFAATFAALTLGPMLAVLVPAVLVPGSAAAQLSGRGDASVEADIGGVSADVGVGRGGVSAEVGAGGIGSVDADIGADAGGGGADVGGEAGAGSRGDGGDGTAGGPGGSAADNGGSGPGADGGGRTEDSALGGPRGGHSAQRGSGSDVAGEGTSDRLGNLDADQPGIRPVDRRYSAFATLDVHTPAFQRYRAAAERNSVSEAGDALWAATSRPITEALVVHVHEALDVRTVLTPRQIVAAANGIPALHRTGGLSSPEKLTAEP